MQVLMTGHLGDLKKNDICTIIESHAGHYTVRRASDGLIHGLSKRRIVSCATDEEVYCHFTFDINSAVHEIPEPPMEYDSLTKSYFGIPQ